MSRTSAQPKRKTRRLPPCVYQKGPSLYLVKKNKWHRLCRADASEFTIYRELAKVKAALEETTQGEMNALFDEFLAIGVVELELSKDTQDLYRIAINKYLRKFCGHMRIGALTSTHVAQYVRQFKLEGKPVMGNRVKAALSSVYSWAMSIGKAAHNPCLGVKRNRERSKTKYVTDEQYLAGFDKASPELQDILAVMLLTGLRQKDLRLMRKTQLEREGIRIKQSKDGKHILIRWSEALAFFVNRACERCPDSEYVFCHSRGGPWTKNGLAGAIRRLGAGWSSHDLRAKAESDHQLGLGLMARYKRAKRVDPVR